MKRKVTGRSTCFLLLAVLLIPMAFLSACGNSLDGTVKVMDQETGEKTTSAFYPGEELRLDLSRMSGYEYAELWVKKGENWSCDQIAGKDDVITYVCPDIEQLSLQVNFLDQDKSVLKQVWLGDFSRSTAPVYQNDVVQGNAIYTPAENKLHQFLALNYVLLVGFIFMFLWNGKSSDLVAAGVSFVFGTGIYSVAYILLLMLRIPASFGTVNLVLFIFFAIVFLIRGKEIVITRKKVLIFLAVYGIYAAVCALLVSRNAAILGYDSYQYIMGGYNLSVKGTVIPPMASLMSRFGLFPMIIYSLPHFWKFDFLYAFQPLFVLTGSLSLAMALYTQSRRRGWNRIKGAALAAVGLLFLLSCYFWLFQTFWIMGNILVAIFLFLAVYFGMQAQEEEGNLFLSYLMLLCMAACRLETPLQGLVIVVMLAGNIAVSIKSKKQYMISYAVTILLWYAALFSFVGLNTTADEISVFTAGPVMGCCILLIAYALLIDIKWVRLIEKNINIIAFLGANGLLVLLFLLKPAHTLETAEILLLNVFQEGMWGATWLMLILLEAGNILYHKKLEFVELLVYLLLITILALGIIRNTPLRLGFGDSANRMVVHVYPLLLYGLMCSVIAEMQPQQKMRRN